MKKLLSLFALMLFVGVLMAQTVTLSFSGRYANNNYCQLSAVVIVNLTKGWQETIYWPDTILTMQAGTGIEDYVAEKTFILSQNNPNPFNGTTEANLIITESEPVTMVITDVTGCTVATQNFASLQTGNHRFRLQISAAGIYFLTAYQKGQSSTIKMVNNVRGTENSIEFVEAKAIPQTITQVVCQTKGGTKGATNQPFSFGDQMKYVGYATFYGQDVESHNIIQSQHSSEDFIFQFAVEPLDSQPCIGASILTDVDGNVYNTVQIGQQCWMKENLRTTKYADNTSISMGSTTSYYVAYRYWPNNDANNVATYGYLYNWKAVMRNSSSSSNNPSGVQGICPIGWHVPSNAEWTQLTNYVCSKSQYVCGEDSTNIAKSLASTTGWTNSPFTCNVGNNPSSNNATGFTAVPAGYYNGGYCIFGGNATFWSATQFTSSIAGDFRLPSSVPHVLPLNSNKDTGYSVRCLKD